MEGFGEGFDPVIASICIPYRPGRVPNKEKRKRRDVNRKSKKREQEKKKIVGNTQK
tara:strand:- start:849 stop:1016 length:168 start_codon:yes stop_codon:yes gene_type:complete